MTVRSIQRSMISDLENHSEQYQSMSKEELEELTLSLAKQATNRILGLVRRGVPLATAERDAYREAMMSLQPE